MEEQEERKTRQALFVVEVDEVLGTGYTVVSGTVSN